MKLRIYEIHIFELRNEEINERRSSQLVINATYAVAKRKPEKIRLAGIRTLTSAIPVQRSNQLSYQANWELVVKLVIYFFIPQFKYMNFIYSEFHLHLSRVYYEPI